MPKKKKKKTTKKKVAKKTATKKKVCKKKKTKRKIGRPAKGLTDQIKWFCKELIIDFDRARAVMAVGDCKTRPAANVMASRWLDMPATQKHLTKLIAKREERLDLKGDNAMIECRRIALADVGDAFNDDGSLKAIKDIPIDLRRCISSFEVLEVYEGTGKERVYVGELKKMKFWDKVKSLDMLFKHEGKYAKNNEQLPVPVTKTKMILVIPKTS